MTPQAIDLIREMNALATRSLPPDLFASWETIFSHYRQRVAEENAVDITAEAA